MRLLLVVVMFSSFGLFAQDAGFIEGHEYFSNYIYGDITLQCTNGITTETINHRCSDYYLDPTAMSKFYAYSESPANKIVLEAIHENGTKTTKSSNFDFINKVSKKEFNLWLRSLLQTPLLHVGKNVVNYTLYYNSEIVKTGAVEIMVNELPSRRCHYGLYHSFNSNDCRTPEFFCSQYFKDENYCK